MSSVQRERALVTKVVETGDVRRAIKQKVTPEHISDPDTREVWRWVVSQYQKFGKTPSEEALADEFPEFKLEPSTDIIDELIDGVRRRKLYSDLQDAIGQVAVETRSDPREGLELLKRLSMELSVAHSESRDVEVSTSVEDIREQYEHIKASGGVLGVPWPWPRLTRITKGIRDAQYIGFYGPTGTYKTFLLVYTANHLHEHHGRVPVFFTKEMPAEDIRFRLAAMRARVNYDLLQDGKLTQAAETRFYETLEELSEAPPFYIHEIQSTGLAAVAEMRAVAQEYEADVLCLDGVYFLAEDMEWQKFAVVNNAIKDMTRSMRVPLISTNQANQNKARGRRDVGDVGTGQSWAQALDVAIRVTQDPVHEEQNIIMLRMKKVREGKSGGALFINAKLAEDFTEVDRDVMDDFEEGADGDGFGSQGGMI